MLNDHVQNQSRRPYPNTAPGKIRFLTIGMLISSLVTAAPYSLNDTGIDVCRDHVSGTDTAIGNGSVCTPAQGSQDAGHGRDNAAATLSKVGASALTIHGNPNGFDFTKISNRGEPLPASAALGSGPDDWACTYDNNTGLMWEIKTDDGPRGQHHTYSWYDGMYMYSQSENPGVENGGYCYANGHCDTEKFTADVNTYRAGSGLCGHSDWRLPTLPELYNLADRGRTMPAIDPDYFPNTPAGYFWSASLRAGNPAANHAWLVSFGDGRDYWGDRGFAMHVRLVRSGL